jgi:hypothetical protein
MSCRPGARHPFVSTVVTLRGPLSAAAVAIAVEHVDGLLARGLEVRLALEGCDLSVVDAVSRMRLCARRRRLPLVVDGADAALFSACGLTDVL